MYSEIAANKRKTIYILLVFLAFIGLLSWLFSEYIGGTPNLTIGVFIGGMIYALISYISGSRMALAVNGAREIQKSDDPRLWRTVENLAITEGLPMPRVFIMDDPALNAFATGRNPQNAAVCATSGLLAVLDDSELEGVIAHEMGHIKNYDIRVSIIVFALVAVVSLLADIIFRFTWLKNDNRNNTVMFGLGIVAALVAPLIASLIQLAVSRRREYLADATGALTTRFPEGLARALEKIRDNGSAVQRQNTSTAHLFFANPLNSGSIAGLFSTHPPIEERIRRLQSMATHE
jgi:heat shock protein HtpX